MEDIWMDKFKRGWWVGYPFFIRLETPIIQLQVLLAFILLSLFSILDQPRHPGTVSDDYRWQQGKDSSEPGVRFGQVSYRKYPSLKGISRGPVSLGRRLVDIPKTREDEVLD